MAQIQFNSNADEVNRILQQNIENALNAVGLYIEGEAKRNIRDNQSERGELYKGRGFLLNNMSYEVDTEEKRLHVGNMMKYAIYVEKGTGIHAKDGNGRQDGWTYYSDGEFHFTHGMEAQPFLEPAVFDNLDTIKQIFIQYMKQGVT